MSNRILMSSNGNHNFYHDVRYLQNQLDAIDKKYEQHCSKYEHRQQYGHQAKLDELLIDLNDVHVSLSSDEYAEKDHGACKADKIKSTEQHSANSDGVLINNHDVQNSQDYLPISELISRTRTILRSQQILTTSEENLPDFPSHVNVGHHCHESSYFNSNESECRSLGHLDIYDSGDFASDVDFHGNAFPVKGQWDLDQGQSNGNSNNETGEANIVSSSIESYGLHQEHGHFYGQIDNIDNNNQDSQLKHQEYDSHYVEGHNSGGRHHFVNISNRRPFHTIEKRKLGEVDNSSEYLNSGNQAFFSHSQPRTKSVTKTALASDGVERKLPQVTYRSQNSEERQTIPPPSKMTPETTTIPTKDKYSSRSKLKYANNNLAMKKEAKNDEKKENWRDLSGKLLEKKFMEQGRQREPLQFSYKEIEFPFNQIDLLKNDSAREIRRLKSKLSIAKGEKEDAVKSLKKVQCLLQESKLENAWLLGRVHACESHNEELKAKEEKNMAEFESCFSSSNQTSAIEDRYKKEIENLKQEKKVFFELFRGEILCLVTETMIRAAEAAKIEVDKKNMSTFKEIKEFFKSSVKNIFESEIDSAAMQKILLAAEEAVEARSSNAGSWSTTPRSVEINVDKFQIRSKSASSAAGISPKSQKPVSFSFGTKGEKSNTPLCSNRKGLVSTYHVSQESKSAFTRPPCDACVKLRGERNVDIPDVNSPAVQNLFH